jgi:hypothetical protein
MRLRALHALEALGALAGLGGAREALALGGRPGFVTVGVGGRKRTDERGRNEGETERQGSHHEDRVGEDPEAVNAGRCVPLAEWSASRWAARERTVTMRAMKATRWSLGETILFAIVIWLATIFLGAVAWNRHWRLPFGFEIPELAVLIVIGIIFFGPSRFRGGDDR